MLQRLFYDLMYRFRRPPWDTGVTPPEVVSLVESHEIKPGRALDLGCGTGTNAMYLAQHGFKVVGIDFSPRAIALARAKARQNKMPVQFVQGDVTRLDFLKEPFDLILDIGCFHGVPASDRPRYIAHVERLTGPGAMYLLYAFAGTTASAGLFRAGISQANVTTLFAPFMELCRVETGTDRGERTSSWYWFKRKES